MKQYNLFPLKIHIYRNNLFFADIQWILYKKFKKKRTIPCGRIKKTSFLCCCQPIDSEHCYYNDNHTEVYCKCCDSIRITSNTIIDLDSNTWNDI